MLDRCCYLCYDQIYFRSIGYCSRPLLLCVYVCVCGLCFVLNLSIHSDHDELCFTFILGFAIEKKLVIQNNFFPLQIQTKNNWTWWILSGKCKMMMMTVKASNHLELEKKPDFYSIWMGTQTQTYTSNWISGKHSHKNDWGFACKITLFISLTKYKCLFGYLERGTDMRTINSSMSD